MNDAIVVVCTQSNNKRCLLSLHLLYLFFSSMSVTHELTLFVRVTDAYYRTPWIKNDFIS